MPLSPHESTDDIPNTNKPDSQETVETLLADIPDLIPAGHPDRESLEEFLKEAGVNIVTFDQWKKIDAAEIARGEKVGKPREKFVKISGMLSAIND